MTLQSLLFSTLQPCRAHSTSLSGSSNSSDCKCVPGYFLGNGWGHMFQVPGNMCPSNSYCPGDQVVETCASNSSSVAGARVIEACMCDPGQWRGCILLQDDSGNAVDATGGACVIDYTQACTDCGEDVICLNNTLLHCPEHSEAPTGSHDAEACICVDGYFNQAV